MQPGAFGAGVLNCTLPATAAKVLCFCNFGGEIDVSIMKVLPKVFKIFEESRQESAAEYKKLRSKTPTGT